jgi:hypothetical protein
MALTQPLSARFNDEFPLILCGPILRRVDLRIASVWVALKKPQRIKFNLYQGYADSDPDRTPDFSSGYTDTLEIGKNLHIAVVTVSTKGLLKSNGVYSYDLHFYEPGSETRVASLESLELLKSPVLLGFKENQLPSFVYAPAKVEDLRVAHGSCRKPHGKGRDGLAALAEVMEPDFLLVERADAPKARPHCFFHTGDQIYADDCSDFLIEHYTDIGNFLLQKIELLPYPANPEDYFDKQKDEHIHQKRIKAVTAAFPPDRRATNFYSGFTGDESNHLYSFAEFCAAYLMQWSDVLWPKDLQTVPEFIESKITESEETASYLFPLKRWEKDWKPDKTKVGNWRTMSLEDRLTYIRSYINEIRKNWLLQLGRPAGTKDKSEVIAEEWAKTGYDSLTSYWKGSEAELKRVEEFRSDLPAARRAMANMPNIMTFDDHDVTDDWYLTGRWTKRALANRLGRTIITNGLLAFALFQSWGNDPASWSGDALALLLQDRLPGDFADNVKVQLHAKLKQKIEGREIEEDQLIAHVKTILEEALTPANLHFTGGDKEALAKNLITSLLTEIINDIPRGSAKSLVLEAVTSFVGGMTAYEKRDSELIEEEGTASALQDWIALRVQQIENKFGYNDLDKPEITWHFSFQLGPARVFALDTRTRRDFSKGPDFSPNLIRKKALDEQLPGAPLPQGTELVIVVSGPPIMGLATVETLGQTMVPRVLDVIELFKDKIKLDDRKVRHRGEEAIDVEHWSLHEAGYEALLKKLAAFGKVVCLSGDVHYGITSEMDYWQRDKPKASRIVQMVSSALKNMNPEGALVGLLPAAFTQVALTKGLNREMDKITSLGWDKLEENESLKIMRQFELGKFREARPGEFPLRIAYAMSKKPVSLTLRDWPMAEFPPATENEKPIVVPRVVINKEAPKPTHIWRLNFVQDTRTDKVRFASLPNDFYKGLTIDVPADLSSENYRSSLDQVLQRNTFFSRTHFSRSINWFSHAAIVHFSKTEEKGLTAYHSMFFFPVFLAPDLRNKPGSFEEPLFQQEVSLEQKPATDEPLYHKEPRLS